MPACVSWSVLTYGVGRLGKGETRTVLTLPDRDVTMCMHTFMWETIRSAVRSFRRRKLFALTAVVILSFALAATNVMFTLVDSVLLRPLPFASPERLVWLGSVRPDRNDAPFSLPDYRDLRDRNQTVAQVGAVARWGAILSGSGPADRLQGVQLTSNIFQLLGVHAEAGRLLLPEDDEQPDNRIIVISDALWRTRFGGHQAVIGKTVILDDRTYTIVGVALPTFQFPVYSDAAVMAPLAPEFHPWKADRNSVNFLGLIARMKDGVTISQLQSDLTGIAWQIARQFPDTNSRKIGVRAIPLQERYTGNIKQVLVLLLLAVSFLLLIGCANLANMVLMQLAERESELAIRTALGASRSAVIQQLAAENLLLAAVAGIVSFVFTRTALPVLIHFIPSQIPRSAEVQVASHVFLFSLGVATLSSMIFGVLPALHVHVSGKSPLGSTRGSTHSVGSTRARNIISAGQIAITVTLLIGTALLSASLSRLQRTDFGFNPQSVLTARISLPSVSYRKIDDVLRFADRFRSEFASTPGVESMGMISDLPLSGAYSSVHFSPDSYISRMSKAPEAQFRVITPGYFRSIAAAVEGRDFSEQDSNGSEAVAIINRELATRYWPAGDALGSRVSLERFGEDGQRTARIVGVVSNIKQLALDAPATFDIYIPLRQANEGLLPWVAATQFWVARTNVVSGALREQLRDALNRADRGAGSAGIEGFDSYVESALSIRRFNLALIAGFGVASLFLAITGVYTVLSYSLQLRRREIATRIALGASRSHVVHMVFIEASRLVLSGLAVGVLFSLAAGQLMNGMLFAIHAHDPRAIVLACMLVLSVALLSCIVPAIRASRTDPMTMLRSA